MKHGKHALCAVLIAAALMMAMAGCASNHAASQPAAQLESREVYSAAGNSSSSYLMADSGGGYAYASSAAAPMATPAPMVESPAMDMGQRVSTAGGAGASIEVERKIVRTASLNQETNDFDEDLGRVRETVESLGGYFEETNISGSAEYGQRSAQMSIRVPVERFDDALNSLREIGKTQQESSSETDLTADYVDNDIRINVLTQNLARLEELQKEAEDVESIIFLQDRMNEILVELDSLQASQRYIVRRAEESTIRLYLHEYKNIVIEPVDETVGGRMKEGFAKSTNAVLRFLEGSAVFFVSALPVLLLFAVIAGAILTVVLLSRRARRKKAPTPENDSETP